MRVKTTEKPCELTYPSGHSKVGPLRNGIFLYMAAEAYHIKLKEVEKVRNCNFNLFAHSLLHTNA